MSGWGNKIGGSILWFGKNFVWEKNSLEGKMFGGKNFWWENVLVRKIFDEKELLVRK